MLSKKINEIIDVEINKAVQEVFKTFLSEDNEEGRRQKRQAMAAQKREIISDADKNEDDNDKKRKVTTTKSSTPEKSEPKKQEDRTHGKGTQSSKKLDEPSAGEIKTPSLGNIIDKLNVMRGGRSLRDPGVKKEFSRYFSELDGDERRTLLTFLTGIAQILAGIKSGSNAVEPEDMGIEIHTRSTNNLKADEDKDSRQVKISNKENQKGTSDQPIVVGETYNTAAKYHAMPRNNHLSRFQIKG